ncbi:MAG TPA: DNA-3-methyladenine glycosylase I, partial [Kofleriaceae bacterium]|nr:DNA-3-methyladenine glycosylase I [Kofleriaceae bacterium]
KKRCVWATREEFWDYHDHEWGVPVHDDQKHYEFLILEGAQAGLSWSTILNKRDGYRRVFAGFDPAKVARFTPARIEKALLDPGIVRNRQKVTSAVNNARHFLDLVEREGSFDKFIWSFVGGKQIVNRWAHTKQIPATSKESDALAKELKKRGFSFVGSTVMYAHMQATGLINDHLVDCFRYKAVTR